MLPSLCYIVRHKKNLLHVAEGEKLGFTPCVYTQNTQIFQDNSIMDENHIGPNINTIPVQTSVKDGLHPSG